MVDGLDWPALLCIRDISSHRNIGVCLFPGDISWGVGIYQVEDSARFCNVVISIYLISLWIRNCMVS